MKDENKTKEELIKELKELRLKNSELEKSKADYRQADKALREREVKYRLIAENTSDLICVTSFNLKATYIYVNHSYKKILGYEPEELIGKSSLDFIHPDDKRKL
ncbi:MAG TPA: PAS domain S-box protein, partial [Spirochaetes bacterium]|nr:PAS domain S-box protein [Spirochaetota bacterium]